MAVEERVNIVLETQMKVDQVAGSVQKIQGLLKNLKMPANLTGKLEGQFTNLGTQITKYKEQLEKPIKTKADLSALTRSANRVDEQFKELLKTIKSIDAEDIDIDIDTTELTKLNEQLEKAQKDLADFGKTKFENFKISLGKNFADGADVNPLDELIKNMANPTQFRQVATNIRDAIQAGAFTEAKQEADQLFKSIKKLEQLKGIKGVISEEDLKKIADGTKEFIDSLAKDAAPAVQNIEDIQNRISNLSSEKLEQLEQALEEIENEGNGARNSFNQVASGAEELGESSVRAASEVEQLTKRVQYFFGLQNQIQLFKRVVREAFETVKELDKTMTETAVVTDFSVGDMWQQLPEYTAEAKALGATINDLYKANTLYYQQGLNSTQAMQLGVETLKMARIAGLEAADATDAMTAALRGFNMELNETSAQRVNDVYSALAAKTASNVEEISTAVEKVASLAYSAGMNVEQTSAFLAQIIETTREAPETAGTALKTIIARFGEVKKLSQQGETTGTDEEGQEIDINKVDTALKTAGISLKDFINGNESLADVFLKLSQRWDTLSLEQQRYIATMAAGARQQSRFIAMMQNTARTQELLGIAYNAEGASGTQFEKTLEGLEAQLNQLKDEWQQFIMGIANSDLIKDFLKVVTTSLKTINNLINGISNTIGGTETTVSSIVKTLLSLGTFVGGLSLSGKVINKGVGALGGALVNSGGIWSALGQKLVDAAGTAKGAGKTLGKSISAGLKKGLNLREILSPEDYAKRLREVEFKIGEDINNGLVDPANFDQVLKDRMVGIEQAGEKSATGFLSSFKSTLSAAAPGIAVVIGLLAAASIAQSNAKEQVRQFAEDIRTTFEEETNEAKGNIEFIENNRARFEELAKGVDAFGNNIGLTNEEYREYKTISDEIGNMSPELVKKWSSEGEALIGKAEALDAVTEAQKENLKASREAYTSDSSINALAEGAALNVKGESGGVWKQFMNQHIGTYGTEADAGTSSAMKAIADQAETELQKSSNKLLKAFDKNFNQVNSKIAKIENDKLTVLGKEIDFNNLDLSDAQWLQSNEQKVIEAIAGDDKERQAAIKQYFASFDKEVRETLDELPPITDALNEYLTLNNLDPGSIELPGEFVTAYQNSLQDIAYKLVADENYTASDAKGAAETMAKGLRVLTGEGSRYADIMKQVQEAQEKYTKTVSNGGDGLKEYTDSTSGLIEQLEQLVNIYGDDTILGKQFEEAIYSQIGAIKNYADAIEVDFASAFNTLNDEIESAEKKISEFSEASSKDYYSTANSFKSMIETMKKEENWEGTSKTLYAGADALLSKKYQNASGKEIKEQIEKIEKYFAEGKEGSDAFIGDLYDMVEDEKHTENLKKLGVFKDENGKLKIKIEDDDTFHKLAEYLGQSDEALASILTKAKQFYKIDFSNVKQAFTALSTADNAVHGTGEHANNVYMRASTMREQLMAQGYRGKDLEKMMSDLKAAGMKFLSVDNIKDWHGGGASKLAKELGETTNAGFIKALYDAGFGSGSIQKIYDQMYKNGQYLEGNELSPDEIAAAVEQIALEESDPSLAANTTTAEQTTHMSTTLDSIATKLGVFTEEDKNNIDTEINKFNNEWGESVRTGKLTQGQIQSRDKLEQYQAQLQKLIPELQSRGIDTSEFEKYNEKITKTLKVLDDDAKLLKDAHKEYETQKKEQEDIFYAGQRGKSQYAQDSVKLEGITENERMSLELAIKQGHTNAVEDYLVNELGVTKERAGLWVLEIQTNFKKDPNSYSMATGPDENAGSTGNVQLDSAGIPITFDASGSISALQEESKEATSNGSEAGVAEGAPKGAKEAGPQVESNLEGFLQHLNGSATVSVKPLTEPFSASLTVNGKTTTGQGSIYPSKAKGFNLNTIPNYASYAQGRVKGGKETALTGELGYEVAWFPSQGTSTILGLNGPEMVDLPKDAVVFPHEQSKKILKGNKNRPQFGSHAGNSVEAEFDDPRGKSGGSTIDPKTKKKIGKATDAIEKIEKSIPIGQRNIELKLSQIASRLDLNMDLIRRNLEISGASKKGLENEDYYKQYRKDLERQEKQSLKLEEKYEEQVNSLGKKGKKNANMETISYGKKGKANVNLNKYIKLNKKTGLYELDKSALKKEKNKSKRNAIAEAAQKLINDTTSKLNKQRQTTLDAIKKQEELDKLVDDTFYNWEMELKRIHEISKQLETLSKRQTRYQSAYELEQSRAQAGFDTEASINNMIASLDRQREVMSQRIQLSGEKIKEAQKQVIDILNPKSMQQQAALAKAKDYYKLELRPDGTYDYDIDTAALEARYKAGELSETDYKDIKDVLDKLEGAMGELEDAVNDQLTTLKEMYDVLNDQRQKMADYEQTLLEGLQKEIEKEINNQKTISASITNQLKKLYDEVKKAIDMRRRQEDNAKTEEDIQKKQQRLAMLRADTSGGNALEIAQLEKEIGDAQQNYQRTLEDQLIQDLQDQADRAAEQREEQIELASLLHQTSTSIEADIAKINEWIAHPEEHEADIKNALKAAYNGEDPHAYFTNLINEGKVNEAYNEIVALKNSIPSLETAIGSINSSVDGIIEKSVNEDGSVKVDQVNKPAADKSQGGGSGKGTIAERYQKFKDASKKGGEKDLITLGSMLKKSSEIGKSQKTIAKELADTDLYTWADIIKAAKKAGIKKSVVSKWSDSDKFKAALANWDKYTKYATGGLNTTAGPAWLDGTKSQPELVLNATDTKNFLQLKDVLSHVMKGASALPDTSPVESNTYEININVDHLNNDYDVDKVAERVKKIIVKDSSYRNVTAVRKFR